MVGLFERLKSITTEAFGLVDNSIEPLTNSDHFISNFKLKNEKKYLNYSVNNEKRIKLLC